MNWQRGLGFVFLVVALLILIDAVLSLSGLVNWGTNLFRDAVGIVVFAVLAWIMLRTSKKH
jgi:hypothetical protein